MSSDIACTALGALCGQFLDKGGERMPIYEYKCNSCDHVFDKLVPMGTEGESLTCPKCDQTGARRLISAFAAHGLENGHIAVGQKLTGKSATESSESKSA